MMSTIGQNTPASAQIMGFIEELERLDAQRKEISESEKLIMAQVASAGLDKKGINYVRKARRMKPHDLTDYETTRDLYMHAAGMAPELPLFREIRHLVNDSAAQDQIIDAFKALVPQGGEVIVKMGDTPMRLWRDQDGVAHVDPYIEPTLEPTTIRPSKVPPPVKKDVPDCSVDEAEALGRAAAKDNQPVISNPFPYDDARRPRWDLGWRKEHGSDGMGPPKK